MFKIALDAGHGLYTSGKRCLKSLDPAETREWVLNSRICDKVEALLGSYTGFSLIRVDDRTGERDIPLQKRTEKANDSHVNFYLSVHHNAGLNGKKGGGVVTISYTTPTETTVQYQKIVHDAVICSTQNPGNRAVPMPKQNLHVLRETNMPAVLIECGFMDSPDDVPKILSEDYADRVAEGITEALITIGNLKRKEEKPVQHPFTDIQNHYAEKQIADLYHMGIIRGTGETHFSPDVPIKRADVAIIARNIIRYITGK